MNHGPIIGRAFIGFAAMLMLIMVIGRNLSSTAPLSDDISMIAFSHDLTWDWLTRGLADYFIVYPEYYAPQSDFIRPVSNFVYWLFSNVFLENAPFQSNAFQLVAMNYGALALLAAFMFAQVRAITNSRWLGTLAGVFIAAIPTFWTTPTPSYTSFVFDELATLFCVLAFACVRRGSLNIAAWCIVLAIFTKEISLPISVAFGFHFAVNRHAKACLTLVGGLALWTVLRLFAYGIQVEGLYVFAGQGLSTIDWILTKVQNVLTLPLGPFALYEIGEWQERFPSRATLLFGINLVLYSAVLWMILKSSHQIRMLNRVNFAWLTGSHFALAFSSAFLGFIFVAYVGANYRYAFIFLPFVILAVAYATPFRNIQHGFMILLTAGGLIASGSSVQRIYLGDPFETYRYEIIRDLFSELRARDPSRPIVVVNDAVLGYASPDALRKILGRDGKIIRGTSLYLDNCPLSELQTISTHLERSDSSLKLTTTLPDCARFAFESSPRIGLFLRGTTILRSDSIHYELAADPKRDDPDLTRYWLGSRMTIVVNHPDDMDVVYYDFHRKAWIDLGLGSM